MLGEAECGAPQTMLFSWTLPCWEQEWLPGGCRQGRGLGPAQADSPGTGPLPRGTGGALGRDLTPNSFPSPRPCCPSTATVRSLLFRWCFYLHTFTESQSSLVWLLSSPWMALLVGCRIYRIFLGLIKQDASCAIFKDLLC